MDLNENADFSDDEVFFGRLSLKEVRKRVLMDIHPKNITFGDDFKIIETNSEPNMHFQRDTEEVSGDPLKSTSDPVFNRSIVKPQVGYDSPDIKSEDSFNEIEKAVTECTSNKTKFNLDNTLDVVDFILNHGPSHIKDKKPDVTYEIKQCVDDMKYLMCDTNVPKDEILSQSASCEERHHERLQKEEVIPSISTSHLKTPIKAEPGLKQGSTRPRNITLKSGSFINTPTLNKKVATNVFKTPKLPLSTRKETPLKKTPSRSKGNYEHIASPIATYIKNSPQVPLVKDVHPKMPLPSTSIPKPIKHAPYSKLSNKENVVLPPLAYRSAKKTAVININKEKLPQSQWVQKFTSSLRKPVVLKHNHREMARKPLVSQQEDSFADLTLHQAEISVCTQKPAFHKPS